MKKRMNKEKSREFSVHCPGCGKETPDNNFCKYCGRKLRKACDCWVLHKEYDCGHTRCPGIGLLSKQMEKNLPNSKIGGMKGGEEMPGQTKPEATVPRAPSKCADWKMQTEFRIKKTGAKKPSIKVHGSGRTSVEAELEI